MDDIKVGDYLWELHVEYEQYGYFIDKVVYKDSVRVLLKECSGYEREHPLDEIVDLYRKATKLEVLLYV